MAPAMEVLPRIAAPGFIQSLRAAAIAVNQVIAAGICPSRALRDGVEIADRDEKH
jgi:hypothetical protein